MSEEEVRKLAAIMFTDMVGYSALSQRDGKLALELLEEHRELLRKIFPRFHGNEIKTIGDAFLVEFNSALEAAHCAIEIQRALAKRNADIAPDRRIEVKIGIHIGDVVHRAGDVYGDGVNIASRIEPLAGAGGICVSMDVERQIRNAVETHLEKLAPTELKNISLPMELFRIVLPWEKKSGVGRDRTAQRKPNPANTKVVLGGAILLLLLIGLGWWWTTQAHKAAAAGATVHPEKIPSKSVAVLPFENLSDDKSNAYFTDGIQDEILTRLSKIADLKVISRTSTQKYKSAPDNLRNVGQQLGVANLLEGSVQKVANAVHVNVQLIRAATDEHLWAESYNRKLDDVFEVEGEVAAAVADQLKAKLTGAEQEAVGAKPTGNLAAYDAYLRAASLERGNYAYDAFSNAASEYARAVQLDPKFALAWARLAVMRSYLFFNAVDAAVNTASSVKEAADNAIALQPQLGEAWVAQGYYRYRVQRDYPGALRAFDEARQRLPNSALVYESIAYVERRLGRWEEAGVNFKKATELDPQDYHLFVAQGCEYLAPMKRFAEAQTALDRALHISPAETGAIIGKALVFQCQGDLAAAAAMLARIPAGTTDDFFLQVQLYQHLAEHRFDEVIELVQQKLNSIPAGQPLDSVTEDALVKMGFCQEWLGRHDNAVQTFNRAIASIKPTPDTIVVPESNGRPSTLALAYAGLGEKEKAVAQGKEALAEYDNDAIQKPYSQVVLAQIQARFGDFDSAITAISHVLEVPCLITPTDLKYNPLWDPLRKDPRFHKLCDEPRQ